MILKMPVIGGLLIMAAAILPRPMAMSLAQDAKPNPRDVLTKVAETYAGCRSYQDSGTVLRTFLASDGKDGVETASFTTTFVRPSSFRFDYQYRRNTTLEHYLIWMKNADVRVWFRQQERKSESLHSAIAALTGVTMGTSTEIPWLLRVDAQKGERVSWANGELNQLSDASVNEKDCLRLRHTSTAVNFDDGSTFDVIRVYWIDKSAFLLRRLETETKGSNFAFRTIISYEPKLNEEIPVQALELNPPRPNERAEPTDEREPE